MKTMHLFSVLLFAVLPILFVGCSQNEEMVPEPVEERTIPVSIGFCGEITSITESPMTRTGNVKDWYVFQVYSKPENSTEAYTCYAYGFFDNTENMIINLKAGYQYKFDVSMVVNGENKVYAFSLIKSGWAKINNSFVISSQEKVRYMYEGYLYLKTPHDTFQRPNVDRFFGRTEGYVPQAGGTVNINMKRVSFGAKFSASQFTEGQLEISVEHAPTMTLDVVNGNEISDVISFMNLEQAYSAASEYSESIPVNIVWVKSNNVRVPVASETVTFKRNKITNIQFEVKEPSSSNSFNLSSDEQMQNGETVEIGGDGTNTGVNPS